MATEEDLTSKQPSLPSYPEMIMEALDALKESEHADRQTISDHIKSKYSELPAEHADLLAANLTAMTENGTLLLVNDSYVKPSGSDAAAAAPVKRGRGRPPKRKEAPAPDSGSGPAPARDPEAGSRGRGRPRKDPETAKPAAAAAPAASAKSGRPRGRPRKTKPETVQNAVEA